MLGKDTFQYARPSPYICQCRVVSKARPQEHLTVPCECRCHWALIPIQRSESTTFGWHSNGRFACTPQRKSMANRTKPKVG